jgi:hypothetical protein
MQVLTGMSRGRSNAEIGKELYLSEDTVKTHARRLFRKMGAADRAQAVAVGFRWGLDHSPSFTRPSGRGLESVERPVWSRWPGSCTTSAMSSG